MKKNMLKIAVLVAFCVSMSSCVMHRHDHDRDHDHHDERPMNGDYHH